MIAEWFLVVVLAGDASGLVPVQRHPTRQACQAQLAVEVVHSAAVGRQVVSATCQWHPIPRLRPVTGEVLR
jgi:hypothetical protein